MVKARLIRLTRTNSNLRNQDKISLGFRIRSGGEITLPPSFIFRHSPRQLKIYKENTVCVQIFVGRIFRESPSSGDFNNFFREALSVPED